MTIGDFSLRVATPRDLMLVCVLLLTSLAHADDLDDPDLIYQCSHNSGNGWVVVERFHIFIEQSFALTFGCNDRLDSQPPCKKQVEELAKNWKNAQEVRATVVKLSERTLVMGLLVEPKPGGTGIISYRTSIIDRATGDSVSSTMRTYGELRKGDIWKADCSRIQD